MCSNSGSTSQPTGMRRRCRCRPSSSHSTVPPNSCPPVQLRSRSRLPLRTARYRGWPKKRPSAKPATAAQPRHRLQRVPWGRLRPSRIRQSGRAERLTKTQAICRLCSSRRKTTRYWSFARRQRLCPAAGRQSRGRRPARISATGRSALTRLDSRFRSWSINCRTERWTTAVATTIRSRSTRTAITALSSHRGAAECHRGGPRRHVSASGGSRPHPGLQTQPAEHAPRSCLCRGDPERARRRTAGVSRDSNGSVLPPGGLLLNCDARRQWSTRMSGGLAVPGCKRRWALR